MLREERAPTSFNIVFIKIKFIVLSFIFKLLHYYKVTVPRTT